jgi:hypothetical protein
LDIQKPGSGYSLHLHPNFITEANNENENMPFDSDIERGLHLLVQQEHAIVYGNEAGREKGD